VKGSCGQGDEYACSIKGGTLLLSEYHRFKKNSSLRWSVAHPDILLNKIGPCSAFRKKLLFAHFLSPVVSKILIFSSFVFRQNIWRVSLTLENCASVYSLSVSLWEEVTVRNII
jgi:hypothetical protein